ncbi:MAG: M1 family metallopeptidase, partial [Actinomycetota bacterium]
MVDPLPLRLDHVVLPVHYDLRFDLDLDAGTWTGHTEITVVASEAVDRVRLHALGLEITDARLHHDQGRDVPLRVEYHPDDEQVVLHVPGPVGPGQLWLELTTQGSLNDQLVGLYRSQFTTTDETGVSTEHTVAVTQFESTHARCAFPCFDEPEFKASFSISVVADTDQLVVSNTAERSRTDLGDGRTLTEFAPTIPMSTYLVALVVGPLEATPVRTSRAPSATGLRVVGPPGNHHLTGFALDVADAALEYFEDYYDIAYPGDKLDLVAVPDFSFGAMENLGCVTFREVLLLIDPDDSTQSEQQRVADVVNHEIAHMWFGDLVTMRWWNGLWLNEAFATFMEVSASDAFRPEWDCWTAFGQLRSGAFDTDALASTRPVEYPVRTPADAEGMFDVLTYEKGCSVLRMLE